MAAAAPSAGPAKAAENAAGKARWRRVSATASESGNDMFDVNRLEERAMAAFGTLESILHTHEQRVAEENVRNQELKAIEERVDSLKLELEALFGRCQGGWQREMDDRYRKMSLKRAIHAGQFQVSWPGDAS